VAVLIVRTSGWTVVLQRFSLNRHAREPTPARAGVTP